MADTMVKILSAENKDQCLCVDTTTTGIVGARTFINDPNWQHWKQIAHGNNLSSFQNVQTGHYLFSDERLINPDGVKIAPAADPPKWFVQQDQGHWIIGPDTSKCIKFVNESAPVKLETRGNSLEFLWIIESVALQ